MQIEIEGHTLPGDTCEAHRHIHVGVQRRSEVVDLHAGHGHSALWLVEVETRIDGDGGIDLRGPYVHGRHGDRFLYLSWGTVDQAGAFTMFRRAKLLVRDIDPDLLRAAAQSGGTLRARLSLTGPDGTPVCGSVRPPAIAWNAD